jgi:hypothetical protein
MESGGNKNGTLNGKSTLLLRFHNSMFKIGDIKPQLSGVKRKRSEDDTFLPNKKPKIVSSSIKGLFEEEDKSSSSSNSSSDSEEVYDFIKKAKEAKASVSKKVFSVEDQEKAKLYSENVKKVLDDTNKSKLNKWLLISNSCPRGIQYFARSEVHKE